MYIIYFFILFYTVPYCVNVLPAERMTIITCYCALLLLLKLQEHLKLLYDTILHICLTCGTHDYYCLLLHIITTFSPQAAVMDSVVILLYSTSINDYPSTIKIRYIFNIYIYY